MLNAYAHPYGWLKTSERLNQVFLLSTQLHTQGFLYCERAACSPAHCVSPSLRTTGVKPLAYANWKKQNQLFSTNADMTNNK